jgi:hypothetical protein
MTRGFEYPSEDRFFRTEKPPEGNELDHWQTSMSVLVLVFFEKRILSDSNSFKFQFYFSVLVNRFAGFLFAEIKISSSRLGFFFYLGLYF